MRMLSGGRIGGLYQSVASLVPGTGEILDVGCGTGGVTAALAAPGRQVTGIDRSPQMLAVARRKLAAQIQAGQVSLRQLSITGLEREFAPSSFDALVCCLVLSELSGTEQRYAVPAFTRLLRPGGVLVLADEALPGHALSRLAYRAGRLPLAAVTYLVTQASTRATSGLDTGLAALGLEAVQASRPSGATFEIVRGRKPAC
ncbi:MAG: class I SAM-dependent methyltransferase [Actinobacteria bacterium]|nr:class I SAM-dependent methyltransferase [Actinomycetota bacterium]